MGIRQLYFCALVFLASSIQNLHAQNSESELRAAYIFNFAKYIKWPTDHQTFVIGVYGTDTEAFDALERTLKGKKIAGKEIQIKIFETFIDIASCQILYCPDIENKRLTTLLEMLVGKSVLLVTKEDLVKRGAMISFIVENDKLRFKIKKDALDRAGLVPTEGLLRLAILL
ncbi:YfiR family protein [Chryseolinea sp. H1M3-3]|uniref:YfiR family protein n=1 Tax=Chryseolinea sp. H1M3-3 TaxID=3034144 RepID=UPI0023ED7528|nr:YfiR family protein [Chryseolinea sp. H1M3-3]